MSALPTSLELSRYVIRNTFLRLYKPFEIVRIAHSVTSKTQITKEAGARQAIGQRRAVARW
jgi:hypothetical protein